MSTVAGNVAGNVAAFTTVDGARLAGEPGGPTGATVLPPFGHFRGSPSGRPASAQAGDDPRMPAGEPRVPGRPRARAADGNRFFASLTGFVLGGTR